MFFKDEEIEIWRKVVTSGVWGEDTEYTFVSTFYGTIQPFTGDDGMRQGQMFENVRYLIVTSEMIDVRKDDELWFYEQNNRVQYRQYWKSNILPHLEIYTTDSQWER